MRKQIPEKSIILNKSLIQPKKEKFFKDFDDPIPAIKVSEHIPVKKVLNEISVEISKNSLDLTQDPAPPLPICF